MNLLGDEARNLFVMAGVVVALLSLRTTIVLARRKQSSDLVFAARNDDNFIAGLRVLRERKLSNDIATLAVIPGKTSDESIKLRYLLNYFEALAVGVRKRIYSEEILYLNYRTTLINLARDVEPFIHETRLSQNVHTAYRELVWLASRWSRAENCWIARLRIEFYWSVLAQGISGGRIKSHYWRSQG